jgi:hypothetical protein
MRLEHDAAVDGLAVPVVPHLDAGVAHREPLAARGRVPVLRLLHDGEVGAVLLLELADVNAERLDERVGLVAGDVSGPLQVLVLVGLEAEVQVPGLLDDSHARPCSSRGPSRCARP